jgi:hypothetical protein
LSVQLVKPVAQLLSQTLAMQAWPGSHAWPQPPQLRASVDSSTQALPHLVRPVVQTQVLLVQTPPLPHWLPQAPQSNAFAVRSTQALSQLVRPVAQVVAQLESEHT